MDEAETLRRDRRLFRIHSITFIVGMFGPLVFAFARLVVVDWVALLLLAVCALALTISGVLAIELGRTMVSNRPDPELGLADPYEAPGDALESPGLWTLHPWPPLVNGTLPFVLVVLGLGMLAMSTCWIF